MKRRLKLALLSLSIAMLTVSCRQLFTTSMGSSLARDKVNIPSSTSVGDLVDIANSDNASDPGVAKEVLGVLAGKDPASILALSTADKAAILNLAPSAAVDMGTITDLAKKAQASDSDTNSLITQAFDSFDSSVDLTAVEVLLTDTETLQTAPVDSLILASSVVLADVASDIGEGGSDKVMDIMANPSTLATSGLSAEQQARMQTIIDATAVLDTRPESDGVMIGDFKVMDFLRGKKS
ncbi:MAG TPA: hypothetical protein PKL75_02725 [Treponemataceae bacterium]|nr:hypothetical protein [Treponemataceae bacterium]